MVGSHGFAVRGSHGFKVRGSHGFRGKAGPGWYLTGPVTGALGTSCVLCWNGSGWDEIDNEPTYGLSLSDYGGELILGTDNTDTAVRSAGSDGLFGDLFDTEFADTYDLLAYGSDLLVASTKDIAGSSRFFLYWDGASLAEVGVGVNSTVLGLAGFGSSAALVGNFTKTRDLVTTLNRVALWDGLNITALGTGVGSRARCAVQWGDYLVVGGDFTTAGGGAAFRVAKWDPDTSTWSAVGTGFNSNVYGLAVLDDELYACGVFTTDSGGGTTIRRFAHYDEILGDWEEVGDGVNNLVNALGVYDGEVWACGTFTADGPGVESYAGGVVSWNPDSGVMTYRSDTAMSVGGTHFHEYERIG